MMTDLCKDAILRMKQAHLIRSKWRCFEWLSLGRRFTSLGLAGALHAARRIFVV